MRRNSPARLLATGLGAGYLPIAPGTWGSAEAIVIAAALVLFVPSQVWPLLFLLTLLFSIIGIPASTAVSREEKLKDPSIVVVDEIAGQFLTLLFVPLSWIWIVAAFLTFRLFDIVKPYPARQLEALPEGWGIVIDDLVAGLYSGLLLYLLNRLL